MPHAPQPTTFVAMRETFKPSHREFITLPDSATQQSTVSTPVTVIETHPDAEMEEIDKVTELSEHTLSVLTAKFAIKLGEDFKGFKMKLIDYHIGNHIT